MGTPGTIMGTKGELAHTVAAFHISKASLYTQEFRIQEDNRSSFIGDTYANN